MQQVTLVMDTSSSPLLLAVEKEGKIYSTRRRGIKQEKLLFPALQTVLKKAGSSLQDIRRVCIIRGPGRFTGIRISLTFASMLACLNQARIYGATVFEVLARQVQHSASFKRWHKQHPNGVLAVVLHAFREEYFLQIFDGNSTGPYWLSREELLTRLADINKPIFVAGTDKNFAPLEGLLGSSYTFAAGKDCRVRPDTLCQLAREDVWQQQALEPLYLKPARFELIKPV